MGREYSSVATPRKALELNNALISVIGDEDTVTGMLLAGVSNVDARRTSNFLVVDSKTTPAQIEEAFQRFTHRNDVAVLIINQYVSSCARAIPSPILCSNITHNPKSLATLYENACARTARDHLGYTAVGAKIGARSTTCVS